MSTTTAPDPTQAQAPTAAQLAARRRTLLALTIEQHALKRRIDLERAEIDAAARAQYDETGEAPTYKVKGLGAIRLEERGGETEPHVVDQAAFDSWVAERFPSESTATITVPAALLEAALEALGFAEVTVHRSEVHTNAVSAAAVLAGLTVVDGWEGLASDEHPPEDDARFEVFDDQGTSVPGVSAHTRPVELRLVVTADPAAKAAACDAAEAAAHTEPDPAPVEDPAEDEVA